MLFQWDMLNDLHKSFKGDIQIKAVANLSFATDLPPLYKILLNRNKYNLIYKTYQTQ
jgi:hypothetical protein